MIGLLIWLIVVLLIAGAGLAVVRAALAVAGPSIQPYGSVVYALIVLVIVLIIVQTFYAGGPWGQLRLPK